MKLKGSRRLVKRLGLALAVSAIVAPAAQARPLDMPPRGLDSVKQRLYADDIRVSEPIVQVRARQYADDLHAPPVSGGRTVVPRPVGNVSIDNSTGFDWGDAGVGAGFALGIMLLGGGAIVAGRHTRRSRLAAV
jgi:hypothetical protein